MGKLKQIPPRVHTVGQGMMVIYEIKHDKVYRMSNNAEFTTMCSATVMGMILITVM